MKYAINEPDAGEKISVRESLLRGFVCGLFGQRAKNNIPIAYFRRCQQKSTKSCDSLYFRRSGNCHVNRRDSLNF